jgi:hypothetical protein
MTATRHDVTIQLDGLGHGHVHIDGQEVAGVRGLTLTGHVDDVPRLELDLRVLDVSTNGEGLEVLIPDGTAATLRAIGWTPPAAVDGGALDGEAFEQLLRDVYRTTVCPEPYTAALVAEAGRARAEADRLRAENTTQAERLGAMFRGLASTEREMVGIRRDRDTKAEAVKTVATALDQIGGRIYRDLHVESTDIEQHVADWVAKVLREFTAYAEEQLAVLNDPAVRAALGETGGIE